SYIKIILSNCMYSRGRPTMHSSPCSSTENVARIHIFLLAYNNYRFGLISNPFAQSHLYHIFLEIFVFVDVYALFTISEFFYRVFKCVSPNVRILCSCE
ncbi:hypothetical protein L9F63_024530, partial [Diploptera punctata]